MKNRVVWPGPKTRLVRVDEIIINQIPVQLVENRFFKELGNRQHRYLSMVRLIGFVTISENW